MPAAKRARGVGTSPSASGALGTGAHGLQLASHGRFLQLGASSGSHAIVITHCLRSACLWSALQFLSFHQEVFGWAGCRARSAPAATHRYLLPRRYPPEAMSVMYTTSIERAAPRSLAPHAKRINNQQSRRRRRGGMHLAATGQALPPYPVRHPRVHHTLLIRPLFHINQFTFKTLPMSCCI